MNKFAGCESSRRASAPPAAPWVLDRASERPLHQQVADALRAQIAAGTLQPGDPLPSEHTQMRQFDVSRGTVRQARAALRAEGAVGGAQGRRFAVRGAPLTQSLGELVSFTAWTASLGKCPGGRVVAFAEADASVDEAIELGVNPGSAVWRLKRIRLADGEPLLIERTVFPEAIGALLRQVDLQTQSVYEQLAARGITVASARHLLDAVPASSGDARLLHISPGSALLRVLRHAFTAEGRPVEWSDDRYRGGRMRFAIENRAGDTGLVRQLT